MSVEITITSAELPEGYSTTSFEATHIDDTETARCYTWLWTGRTMTTCINNNQPEENDAETIKGIVVYMIWKHYWKLQRQGLI